MRKQPKYGRFEVLPPDFANTVRVCTILEAAAFLRCSEWDVHQRIRNGQITAFKDASRTKIEVASLVRAQDRALASRRIVPSLPAQPVVAETKLVVTKRPVGRPRKPRAEEHRGAQATAAAKAQAPMPDHV
jgi:hypothetical protein